MAWADGCLPINLVWIKRLRDEGKNYLPFTCTITHGMCQ